MVCYRRFGKSLVLLERLFSRIEPIEEPLAVRICFLLLDVYFALGLTEKAVPVVTHLDKALAALKDTRRWVMKAVLAAEHVAVEVHMVILSWPARP